MPVTYNSGTNTITVTGYTAGTPCTFLDVYNADVAGGWGVVTRQCTNQFCFSCYLVIGNGSTATYFADKGVHVHWSNIWTAHWQIAMRGRLSSHITLTGCTISIVISTWATAFGGNSTISEHAPDFNLHYCLITALSGGGRPLYVYSMTGTVDHCVFYNSALGYTSNLDIKDVSMSLPDLSTSTSYGILKIAGGTLDDIKLYDCNVSFYVTPGSPAGTYKNIVCDNIASYDIQIATGVTTDHYFINTIFPASAWRINYTATYSRAIYRQYEFDLSIVDNIGAGISTTKVKIWDKLNVLVTNVNTNTSGVLATQTMDYGYYNQAGGNTPVMKTPHELRIYKYGKLMLSSKSSIETKTDWALTMYTDPNITQTTEATVAAYIGITINHTTETITISSNHTLDEIYDYCQYDMIAATKQLDQTVHTADGINFVSEYSFVVNTGVTVTATDQKLSMVSGETYTLTGTAQFTGIIATTTTTRIPVKLTNIIDGSRYWVGKESDGSKIFEGTQSGSGTVTGYYEHTANTNIDIRVRKSSTSVKYKPWIGEGTLIAETFSLRIRQIQDGIVT